MNLQWVNSRGGPLVCSSYSAARAWRGTRASSIGVAQTDYERACDQKNYADVVACGTSEVLILGDEPLQSAFLVKDGVVLIVRWVSCLSSELAVDVVTKLPSGLPVVEAPIRIRLADVGLIMFDSALDGSEIFVGSNVDLKPGVFTVTTESCKREGVYEFLVHRLLREQGH
jgi:hypothetical protein